MSETIIETRTCRACSIPFSITDRDMEFYAKVSPIFNGKKELIPPSTLCPECRQQRRLTFRNERNLYKRTCDLTRKDIISIYSPDKPYIVYESSAWWWDGWDPLSHGRPFDFSRPFFEQFKAMQVHVPRPCLHAFNYENCDYTNQSAYSKNCYLAFTTDYSEDCMYTHDTLRSVRLVDISSASDCEVCHQCHDIVHCQNLFSSRSCTSCQRGYFLENCEGCADCIGCVGLVNARYCVSNVSVGKEAYENTLHTLDLCDTEKVAQIRASVAILRASLPSPSIHGAHYEDSTGDFLFETKNSHDCYICNRIENLKYCTNISDASDSYDWDYVGYHGSLVYEAVGTGDHVSQCVFCTHIWGNAHNLLYTDLSLNVSHLFGCAGLRNKSYCILNKQYTKEEYAALVPKIIAHMRETGEWGEFFPADTSPFGHNESVSYDSLPLSHEDALAKGFNWSDYEPPAPQVSKTLPAHLLPDDITKIPDDILNWAIICEVTGKPFRIIKQELDFYRKHKLPIPRRHPDQRHLDRMALRNPRKLFERKCDKCWVDMQTTYAPDRPEIVYCETCYNKEIYG